MCRSGVVIADIGTDHALLACHLAQNGARAVIASDVRDGPLEAARRTVAETGTANVTIIRSDGLKEIDYADDIVICGMGGELIADIIAGCRFLTKDTRFILQPMTKADELRRRLYSAGFEIIEERTAYDSGRGYVVMLAAYTGNPRKIDDIFALTGKITDPLLLRNIAEKLLKKARGMEISQGHSDEISMLRRNAEIILAKAGE